MKYHQFWMIALICLCCLGALVSCAPQVPVAIDPHIPQLDEQEMTTPLGEDGQGLTPREIKIVTDRLLKEEYGIDDLSVYRFDVRYSDNTDKYHVDYTLYIQGYDTYEEYDVELDAQGKVLSFNARQRGKYSCYLKGATEARVAAAKADIEKQTRKYDDHGAYYLGIDDEGYLCLWVELIVDVPDGKSGDCGDHDHLFFHSRICGPDT